MMLGLVWMMVANAAALIGAQALLARVRTGDSAVDAVLFLLLRLALISGAVLFAGLTGGLTPWGLGFLGLAVIGGLLSKGVVKGIPRPDWRRASPAVVTLAALLAIRALLQVWAFAPHLGDALSYHLPKIAEWIQAGRFTRELGVDSHASLPAGLELIETWWTVFLHHDVLIEMAGLEFLTLGTASVVALARWIGLEPRTAFWAGLTYFLTPGAYFQALSCLNDGAVAATWLGLAVLIVSRAPLGLALLAAGLGLGVKPTFAYGLPGLLLLAWFQRREPATAPPSARWTAGLAALGIAVGLFWYARNMLWYGNPVFPIGPSGFHAEDGSLQIQMGPSLSGLFQNVTALIDVRIYDAERPHGALLVRSAGWGAGAFAVGALGLVAGLREDARLRRLALGFGVSLASTLLLIRHDDWFMRSCLAFPALLAIAAARAAAADRPQKALLALALVAQFLGTLLPASLPREDCAALWRQDWKERSAARFFDAETSGDSVACLATDQGSPYLLYGPDYARKVLYLRVTTEAQLIAAMKTSGIRRLYAAPSAAAQVSVLSDAVAKGRLRPSGNLFYDLSP